jgi:acyl carrier protein
MARMTPNPAQVKLDNLYLQRISENSMSAVQDTVFGIIAKEAGIDIATIKPDSTLKDLNIQSLDAVQIIFEIEDHYKITLPDRDPNFDTESVKGLIDAVEKLVAEKTATPSAG